MKLEIIHEIAYINIHDITQTQDIIILNGIPARAGKTPSLPMGV